MNHFSTGRKFAAFVIADGPKDTYYVFVSLGRQERSAEEFRRHMYLSNDRRNNIPTVAKMVELLYYQEAGTSTRDSILGMLKKEFGYVETPEQTPKLDDRERRTED